jgi:hypothetical protein
MRSQQTCSLLLFDQLVNRLSCLVSQDHVTELMSWSQFSEKFAATDSSVMSHLIHSACTVPVGVQCSGEALCKHPMLLSFLISNYALNSGSNSVFVAAHTRLYEGDEKITSRHLHRFRFLFF